MLREGGRGKAGRVPRVQAVNVRFERPYPFRDVDCSRVRLYRLCMWQHPWLRVERLIRSILADRLTRGPSESLDQVLMARIKERERIQRMGWFN